MKDILQIIGIGLLVWFLAALLFVILINLNAPRRYWRRRQAREAVFLPNRIVRLESQAERRRQLLSGIVERL